MCSCPLWCKVFFVRLEHVIGCFHVTAPSCGADHGRWPCIAMRGAEAHQTLGLPGPLNHHALSAPDLADRLPSHFGDFLTPPRVRGGLRSGCCHRRILEALVCCVTAQRPRAILLASDGPQNARFLGQHPAKPAPHSSYLAACVVHDGHRSGDEQSSNVALAHLRGFPKALLATGLAMPRYQPKPDRKVAPPF